MTENEKAKFQNPFTYNDQRNFVECNPVKKISDDLVYPTKSHTSSDSIFSEEREEITEDVPAPAEDIPAPAPTPAPSEEREEITEDIPAPVEDYLHLHLQTHWRQSRDNLTLQDQESQ